jgi:hypothetical protein
MRHHRFHLGVHLLRWRVRTSNSVLRRTLYRLVAAYNLKKSDAFSFMAQSATLNRIYTQTASAAVLIRLSHTKDIHKKHEVWDRWS